MKHDTAIAVCATALPGTPPEWVLLIPAGDFQAWDGRADGKWALKDAAGVIRASTAQGVDLTIDYDHQSEYVEKNGLPAIAAGWVKQLEARADGIWGRVEWTEKAAAHLAAKEYRYLSPVFYARKGTGEVLRIVSAALTNRPAAVGLALTSHQHPELTDSMNPILKALLAALGLAEDATQEKAVAAVAALKAGADAATAVTAAIKPLRAAVKLGDDADVATIATAAVKAIGEKATGAVDPNAFVPRAEFERVQTSLAALQKDRGEEKAIDAVDAAIAAGKLAPASKEWAITYASQDLAGFKKFVEGAPVIVKPGSQLPGGKPGAGGDDLSDEERAVCKTMGIDPKDYVATRKEMAQ